MEYMDLVGRIVAAEQNARALVQEAKEQEQSLEADLEQEISTMRETYMERARHRVEEVKKTEVALAKEDLARWDRKREQTLAAVESSYARHKDFWVDVLFRKIVGGAS